MNRITIILVAAATVVAGCSRPGIKGDGVIKSEDRSIADFSRVVVTGGYEIQWSSGKPALNLSTDQNLLPLVETVVSGDTLQIESKDNLAPTKRITITLGSSSLAEVRLTGGNSFKAGQIAGHELKIESTGASEISIDGSITNLEVNLTGANHLNAKSLQAQTATLSLVGASEAEVAVTDALKVSLTGACSVAYSGNPKTVEKTVTGAGSIRHLP